MKKTIKERFDSKWIPEPYSGCWLWTASRKSEFGYGQFTQDDRRTCYAHRASWQIHHGEIPDKLWVLHRCDTPACVNPDHLFLGTHTDNMRDGKHKGRFAIGAKRRSKLSWSDVEAIRASTDSQRTIAKAFGVQQQSISKIKLGLRWQR